ncbi:MAG: BrnT family toxin [Halothece sp.]
MLFEYDPNKSESNRLKHGIDFEEAQRLWLDSYRIEVEAKSTTENRSLVIGKIDGKHWSAIITYRGESIRIISVRRSREKEVELYES